MPGEVGEVGEGLVADMKSVTITAAEEVAGVGFAFVVAYCSGHMHSGVFYPHASKDRDSARPVKEHPAF